MFIKSNIEAMQTHQNMVRIDSSFNKSLAKISSGMALPKPSFGGGMYAAANDMEALYQQYIQGAKNLQDGQGLLEITQTVMMEVNEKLLQMSELAMRAATGTMNDDQRVQMDAAYQELMSSIDTLITEARYNNIELFNARAAETFTILFGEAQSFDLDTYDLTEASLGYNGTDINTQGTAATAITAMENAIDYMSEGLATIGARANMLESKANIVNEQAVQEKALEARINEVDYAQEMKNFTSLQVVLQASNAMVAQANMKAQMVLQLFGQ